MSTNYQAIFQQVEETLLRVGSEHFPVEAIRASLEPFRRLENQHLSDDECFRRTVSVIFYSGFRAATVNNRLDSILQHLGDYRTVARYGRTDIEAILSDPGMIRHAGKVNACVHNAEALFAQLVDFAKQLNEEERRGIREQLDDEQSAIFDILTRPSPKLTKAEREQVKRLAWQLLDTLKAERLAVGAIGTTGGAAGSRPAPPCSSRFKKCWKTCCRNTPTMTTASSAARCISMYMIRTTGREEACMGSRGDVQSSPSLYGVGVGIGVGVASGSSGH